MLVGCKHLQTVCGIGIGSLTYVSSCSWVWACVHLQGDRLKEALPTEEYIKNVFLNLGWMLVMFPDGKWPNHWVDSYVCVLRRKCLCGDGWEGRRRIRIRRMFMNTIGSA